jgi:hypothetical protein
MRGETAGTSSTTEPFPRMKAPLGNH